MSEQSQRIYDYPVYGTQGGGLVRFIEGKAYFVEKPDCPGVDVGDQMHEEWDVQPANELARQEVEDSHEFGHDIDLFFDIAIGGVMEGRIPPERVDKFFSNVNAVRSTTR